MQLIAAFGFLSNIKILHYSSLHSKTAPFTRSSQICHQLWMAICACQRGVSAAKVRQSYKCTAGYNELQICIKLQALFHQRTHLHQLHLLYLPREEWFCFLLPSVWSRLFKSGWIRGWCAFKWESLTVCVGVQVCFSVCIHACLHVGGSTCLVIRLFSSLGYIFTYLTFAWGNSSETRAPSSFSAEYMKHKNKKSNTAQCTQ